METTGVYSDRKRFIRVTEVACLLCLAASLLVVWATQTQQLAHEYFPYVQAVMLSTAAWSSLFAGALVAEFTKVRRFGTAYTSREAAMHTGEYPRLLKWCPVPARPIQFIGFALAACALLVLEFELGPQPTNDPYTLEALGRAVTSAAAMLVVYPVLASASRMSGTYAQHFHPRLRRKE